MLVDGGELEFAAVEKLGYRYLVRSTVGLGNGLRLGEVVTRPGRGHGLENDASAVLEGDNEPPGVPVVTRVARRLHVCHSGCLEIQVSEPGFDWYPAAFAEQVPDLLSTVPGQRQGERAGTGDDLLAQIEEKTGRRVRYGRDAMHTRTADQREATRMGLDVGAPILAGAHEWSDDHGVIVYGEWCLPQRLTIGYEYEM